MKRLLPILIFFCTLLAARAADLVVSNNAIICIFGDSYMISDASAGVVTGYRFTDYLESYFQLNYPGSNIHVFNISRSGGTMEDVLTNRVHQLGLPLWAYQFNNYQHIGISQPTDNGSLSSNQMYLSQSNIFLAPSLMSAGNDTLVTNAGWTSTNTIQWIGLGDPPGESSDGGALTVKARNDASTNAGVILGVRGVDSFNILSNSWVNDINNNAKSNTEYVDIPAPHFLSGGGGSWTFSFLHGITTDTNISTCTLDWHSSTPSATNHCVISSISLAGNTLTFTRHDDRLPMAFDVPDGTITNDARKAFALIPSDADFFKFTLQITNLPPGTYTVSIDSSNVATLTAAQLAAGWNMFTNYDGPYWAQRKEVLGRIRDKEHVDRTTLAHGSADGHGMFSYSSAVGTPWAAGLRGDALISSTITNNVTDVFGLDALTAAAAVPTNHIFAVTLNQVVFAPFHR